MIRRVAQRILQKFVPDARARLLSKLSRDTVGAEIGVHLGDFSKRLLADVRPRTLHLIDPWVHLKEEKYEKAWYGGAAKHGQLELDARYEKVCERFSSEIASGKVVIHRATSVDAASEIADGALDWAYIDGNHLYDFVKQDLEVYFAKLKPGGLLTGDDYQAGGWWEGGVKRAVDEFVDQAPVELIEIYGTQFVLKKNG